MPPRSQREGSAESLLEFHTRKESAGGNSLQPQPKNQSIPAANNGFLRTTAAPDSGPQADTTEVPLPKSKTTSIPCPQARMLQRTSSPAAVVCRLERHSPSEGRRRSRLAM